MRKLKLSADIFTFRHKGKHVIYAPLRHVMILGNDALANLIASIRDGTYEQNGHAAENKIIQLLREKGLLDAEPEKPPMASSTQPFQPTAVTLFPTNQCNLRCTYCYASAGDGPAEGLKWPVAKAAIDLVASNAQKLNQKRFSVGFHGGGEPTLRWAFFIRCVDYARQLGQKLDMQVTCSAASNGAFTEKQREWIVKNLDSLSISLDGPADIQNQQRPLLNGKGSFDRVYQTLKAFDAANFNYGLRSTITNRNVLRMQEIAEYFLDHFHAQRIHFEPLFLCGRCLTNKVQAPAPSTFIREFLKANAYAETRGAQIAYSGLRIGGATSTFCGACGDNFCVTPEGDVTSCFEVTEKQDSRSELFFYGQWQPEKKRFDIWENKLKQLKSFNVQNISYCSDCIAKWHCAGDCLAKVSFDGDVHGKRGSDRCWMNQQLTKKRIVQMIENPKTAGTNDAKQLNSMIKEEARCKRETGQSID